MVEEKVIDKELVEELRMAFVTMEGLKELMTTNLSKEALEIILKRYEEVYDKYNKIWAHILTDLFGIKDISTSGLQWKCDFNTCTVVVEPA